MEAAPPTTSGNASREVALGVTLNNWTPYLLVGSVLVPATKRPRVLQLGIRGYSRRDFVARDLISTRLGSLRNCCRSP